MVVYRDKPVEVIKEVLVDKIVEVVKEVPREIVKEVQVTKVEEKIVEVEARSSARSRRHLAATSARGLPPARRPGTPSRHRPPPALSA